MKKIQFVQYELVWAKYKGYPYLPAMILNPEDGNMPWPAPHHRWVYWFGEKKVSQIPEEKLLNFYRHFNEIYNKNQTTKEHFKEAMVSIIKECYMRCDKKYDIVNNNQSPTTKAQFKKIMDKFGTDFPNKISKTTAKTKLISKKNTKDLFHPPDDYRLSETILQDLENTKRFFADDESDNENDNKISIDSEEAAESNSQDDKVFIKIADGKQSLMDVCIVCKSDKNEKTCSHPLFEGSVCVDCEDEMLNSLLIRHYDGVHAYCAICFEGGNLYVCCEERCMRSYCKSCLLTMAGSDNLKQIENTANWLCFLCAQVSVNNIKPKKDWQENTFALYMPKNPNTEIYDSPKYKEKEPLRVLSLFDGIGAGKYALDQVGIEIDTYFASEIDKDAILISTINGKGKIQHIGDVTKINETMLTDMGTIDLLIGGSPCNDLALVNPARKGIWDGTGPLFFEFYRVKNLIQRMRRDDSKPFFWFFENVMRMERKTKDIISRFLECDPVTINAGKYSPQNRSRYFWGNIPGLYRNWENNLLSNFGKKGKDMAGKIEIDPPNIYETSRASHILTPHSGRIAGMDKINSITTNQNSLQKRIATNSQDSNESTQEFGCLWVNEIEKAFGFPEHFTDYSNLTPRRRQELLGKSWSVSVILHILSPLKEFYASKKAF